jgi:two-component system, cell cycle response regulator DivK
MPDEILVVDDNPQNLKLARVVLAREGHVVRTARDAEEALQIIQRFPPRLILMDLQLPGLDGFSLTRQLKTDAAFRDIVVIALTANAMKGDEERALAAGCDAYLAKPIDIDDLVLTVRRHLGDR